MSNEIAQRRITGQKTAPTASTPLKTPYRLGDVLKNGQAAEEFSGEGEFTELSSSEHSAFAFIVTGMAEETSHNAKCKATAEFIVRACNSHDALVTQLKDALELIELLRANSFDRVLVEDEQIAPMRAALAAAGAPQ